MTTANEAWMDALIRHQIGLMRVAPGISASVNDLLNKSESDMIKQIKARYAKGMDARRLDGLLKSVRAARSTAWKDVDQLWADAMESIAQAEPAFLDTTLNTVSPAQLAVTLPTAERLTSIAKSTPFQGRIMSDWASRVEQGDLDRIEQAIKVGLLQGQNVAQISARIVGTVQMKGTDGLTQITRNNADSLTRTAVNAMANNAKQEFYAENADILGTEVFLATLDARTTLVCAGNDNKQFPIGQGPIPPLHWRCRSLRLATLNGEVIGNRPMRNFTEKQLLREYAEKNQLGKITKRDQLPHGHKGEFDAFSRKRMRELTGTVPARTSYNEWLKGQSASFQDDVLGKARGKLFRDGDLTLDKFVSVNGDKLTLEQLRMQDAAHLQAAVPNAEPFKKTTHAQDLMNEKIGPQSGSNVGGLYRGADGVERYIKHYPDPAQASSEHIANKVYNMLGYQAPESELFTDPTKPGVFYASKIVPGSMRSLAQMSPEDAKQFVEGFWGDVLTKNWDVLGLDYDNVVWNGSSPIRIDNGSAFQFRAQGALKPKPNLGDVGEDLDGFFHKNPQYRSVLEKAGVERYQDLAPQLDAMLARIDEKALLELAGGDAEVREILKIRLGKLKKLQSTMASEAEAAKIQVAKAAKEAAEAAHEAAIKFEQQAMLEAEAAMQAEATAFAKAKAAKVVEVAKQAEAAKQVAAPVKSAKKLLTESWEKLGWSTNEAEDLWWKNDAILSSLKSQQDLLEALTAKGEVSPAVHSQIAVLQTKQAMLQNKIAAGPNGVPATVQVPKVGDGLDDLRVQRAGEEVQYGEGRESYTPEAKLHFEVLADTLHEDEMQALQRYSGMEYDAVRHAQAEAVGIRPVGVDPGWLQRGRELMKSVESAQSKLEMKNPVGDGRLYRGMSIKSADLKSWIEKGVLDQSLERTISTSVRQEVSWEFAHSGGGRQRVMIVYHKVKSASPLLSPASSNGDELEMLLKGSKQRITQVTYDADTKRWILDVEPW